MPENIKPNEDLTKEMVSFLKSHHVFTLATVSDNRPWCAQCFYVYVPEWKALVFSSDSDTKHALEFVENPCVAASVLLETETIGKIQGVQMEGVVEKPEGGNLSEASRFYLKRFPYAVLIKTTMWVLRLTSVKMTDNRFGFGKKQYWSASQPYKL